MWEIFFLPTPGFELGTSGSLVLHSTSVQQWLLVFPSEIGGGIVLIGPVRDFLFAHTRSWTGDLWISSTALYYCATLISGFHLWQFQLLNSGAEVLVVVLFWLDLWEIFFLSTPGFEQGTSGSQALHSTTVPQWFLVITSEIDSCIVLTGPVRDFLFAHTRVWTGNLCISSTALYPLCHSDFWFSGFELGTSGSLVLHSTTVPG